MSFSPVPAEHPHFSGVDQIARAHMARGLADIEQGTLKVSPYTRGLLGCLANLVQSFPRSLGSAFAQEAADILWRVEQGHRS